VVELRRSLGLFDAFAIGVGAIVGAGIFVVIGVSASLAGPALIVSLLIGAAVSALTAMSFAELATRIPKEGGGYEFAHELVSPYGGFLSGWMWLISNIASGAAVAIGLAGYMALFIPLPLSVMAGIACVGVTALNLWGIRESAWFNDVLVVFKIGVLVLFVMAGLVLINVDNFSPFSPNGPMGVMEGAALIFFAFSGFGRVAMISEEVRDPQRTVPKAIILSLVASTLIYLLVAVTAIGLIGTASLGASDSPLTEAALVEGQWMGRLVTVAALAATLSVLLTTLLGVSRISFAMARNGDLPSRLVAVHPRTRSPYIAVLVFGALMTLLALSSSLLFAAAVSNFASLVYYILVNYSAIKMKAPIYAKALPWLGLASCLVLMVFLDRNAWILGVAALIAITAWYFLRKKRVHPGA
jgi:APA family basic amino acid/polyamine antiporter